MSKPLLQTQAAQAKFRELTRERARQTAQRPSKPPVKVRVTK